ncbi:cytidine deaminase [bacterium]|nr:cytidine deaminase [bacterium]
MNDMQKLVERALSAVARSYSVYSGFAVGAAVLTDTGEIYVGTNVENASYGLSICAERVAICNMVSACGARRIMAIAIVASKDNPVVPCGACLQFISEFAEPGCIIVTLGSGGDVKYDTLSDLLPNAFTLGKREDSDERSGTP